MKQLENKRRQFYQVIALFSGKDAGSYGIYKTEREARDKVLELNSNSKSAYIKRIRL